MHELFVRIDNLLENVESNINSDFFSEMCSIFIECHNKFEAFSNAIHCLELEFMNNRSALKRFIMDNDIISLNENMERNVNALISLKKAMISIFNEITIMSQQTEGSQPSNLWPNVSSINSSSSIVITHYVVSTLGKYLKMNEDNLNKTFSDWKPGETNDPIEKEVYKMYKTDPFSYWSELNRSQKWGGLAQIALRIISIPPTEAACERVFSARRDIVTKHVSNIRDPVVEARAHIKSGLHQQQK